MSYAFFVGVQNVNEERAIFVLVFLPQYIANNMAVLLSSSLTEQDSFRFFRFRGREEERPWEREEERPWERGWISRSLRVPDYDQSTGFHDLLHKKRILVLSLNTDIAQWWKLSPPNWVQNPWTSAVPINFVVDSRPFFEGFSPSKNSHAPNFQFDLESHSAEMSSLLNPSLFKFMRHQCLHNKQKYSTNIQFWEHCTFQESFCS